MSWQCRLIEYGRNVSGQTLQIGDMFYGCTDEEYALDQNKPEAEQVGWYWPHVFTEYRKLSEYYKQHNAHRRPLLVWLPGRTLFCVDRACWGIDPETNRRVYTGGWQVTGEAPNLTVGPSINIVGSYHGWLINGVISDDCEGRRYDPVTQNQIR